MSQKVTAADSLEAPFRTESANFGLLLRAPLIDFLRPAKLRAIVRSSPFSLLSYERMAALYESARHVERSRLGGAIVELGVCNGGSAGVLGSAIARNPKRKMWLLDSWQGMPVPTAQDVTWSGEAGVAGMTRGSRERVEELLFKRLGLKRGGIHLVKGWYEDSLPPVREAIGDVALLHLDCDWYESVRFCLEQLYDQVVPGGRIHIDDYGHWQGARRAVDEFLEARGLRVPMQAVDSTGVWFTKPDGSTPAGGS